MTPSEFSEMADSASENYSQEQNSKRVRVNYSRAKSSEENSKQLKEWKKRKREKRRAAKLMVTRREGNEKPNPPTCDTRIDQKNYQYCVRQCHLLMEMPINVVVVVKVSLSQAHL